MTNDLKTMDPNNFRDFSDTEKLLGNTQVPPYKPQQMITLFPVSPNSSLPPFPPQTYITLTQLVKRHKF